jgi:Protein of unknown function (DUF2845)
MRYKLSALVVLSALQSPCFAGEQFRCGQWVVSEDTSVAELLKKCGEPTSKTANTEKVFARNSNGYAYAVGTTTTEVWTYDRGSRSFPMIVTIIDGELKRMSRTPAE